MILFMLKLKRAPAVCGAAPESFESTNAYTYAEHNTRVSFLKYHHNCQYGYIATPLLLIIFIFIYSTNKLDTNFRLHLLSS